MILYTSITVVGATVCTIAARQVQMHRWKVFFLISILVHLAMGLLRCADLLIFSGTYGISQALGLALNFVLLVVVAMDALKRKPYPWPHFLGVVLCFWQVLFGLVCYVIFSWFPEML